MEPIYNKQSDINLLNKELKKSLLSFKNRLQSIIHDANFVKLVHESLEYPIVANERCGLWYVPPKDRAETCYFKSTDGHTNVWSFSLRRLNLHLLSLVRQNGEGVMIVDSTRRGKRMPDALLKTIPIWCAVLNKVLYDKAAVVNDNDDDIDNDIDDNDKKNDFEAWFKTPDLVPESEHNSILKLIPDFVKQVKEMNLIDVEKYRLDKPLVPRWFYPGCPEQNLDDSVYNICCVSASTKVDVHRTINTKTKDGLIVNFEYIQGSADDHELWIPKSLPGLDADVFWHIVSTTDILDKTTGYLPNWLSDGDLEKQIKSLTTNQALTHEINLFPVGSTGLKFGKIERDIKYLELEANTVIFHDKFKVVELPETCKDSPIKFTVHHYPVPSNKKGSNMLREIFPKLNDKLDIREPLVVLCGTGQDISIGMILALLCMYYNLEWDLLDTKSPTTTTNTTTTTAGAATTATTSTTSEKTRLQPAGAVSKAIVKKHLSKLSESYKVNPSRSTLQSVNSFLFT